MLLACYDEIGLVGRVTWTLRGTAPVEFMFMAVRNQSHRYTETHLPYAITQCHLPPGRADISVSIPANWKCVAKPSV